MAYDTMWIYGDTQHFWDYKLTVDGIECDYNVSEGGHGNMFELKDPHMDCYACDVAGVGHTLPLKSGARWSDIMKAKIRQ